MSEDTNVGIGTAYLSQEEREIERLEEICRKYGALITQKNARIVELELEAKDDERLRDIMRNVLVATANVLKGDPGPLKQHSWHDLADWARLKCTEVINPPAVPE
jgi:hypothetical protein